MKRLIIFMLLCAPAALNAQTGNEYIIKGTIVNETGKKVLDKVVLNYDYDGLTHADTVKLIDNTFEFRGVSPSHEPIPANFGMILRPIEIEGGVNTLSLAMVFYLEPGTIFINLADGIEVDPEEPTPGLVRIGESLSVTGTPLNDENMRWSTLFSSLPKQEYKELADRYITDNPDSWISLIGLFDSVLDGSKNPDEIQALLDRFSERMRGSSFGKQKQEHIEYLRFTAADGPLPVFVEGSTDIGAVAPDFTLPDTDLNPVSLSDLRGRWVLIDFWATWCGPCRGENPDLIEAYEQFKDKDFTILGISLDTNKKSWLKMIEEDGLPWMHVSDLKNWNENRVRILYGVEGIPSNFLIDPEGVIVARNLRGQQVTEELEKHLR